MNRTPTLVSRLPAVGTTIFTVMSALAQQHGAVNLGQGFPDFECDPLLLDAVNVAMRAGHNQYPPMTGIVPLREAVARKIEALYGAHYAAGSEITITATLNIAGDSAGMKKWPSELSIPINTAATATSVRNGNTIRVR